MKKSCYLSWLLVPFIFLLLLIGCTKNGSIVTKNKEKASTARYIEQDITPPTIKHLMGSDYDLFYTDNKIIFASISSEIKIESEDNGQTWKEEDFVERDFWSVKDYFLLDNGDTITYLWDEGVFIRKQNGEKQKIDVYDLDIASQQENEYDWNLIPLSNNTIIIDYTIIPTAFFTTNDESLIKSNTLVVSLKTGEMLYEFPREMRDTYVMRSTYVTSDQNFIYVVDQNNRNTIHVLEINTGKPSGREDIVFPKEILYEDQISAMSVNDQGDLLVMGDSALYCVHPDNTVEIIIDSKDYSFEPGSIRSVSYRSDGSIILNGMLRYVLEQ